MAVINDNLPRIRSTFYVESPIKENKAKEKLLGITPDRLGMGGLPPIIIE